MSAQIVVEANHGSAYLTGLLERVMIDLGIRVTYRTIHASQGKRTRAEPVTGLYAQRKVHHLGTFSELEDQLCTWDGSGPSPDRMDAMAWAITELMGYARRPSTHSDGVVPYTDAATPGVVRWPEISMDEWLRSGD